MVEREAGKRDDTRPFFRSPIVAVFSSLASLCFALAAAHHRFPSIRSTVIAIIAGNERDANFDLNPTPIPTATPSYEYQPTPASDAGGGAGAGGAVGLRPPAEAETTDGGSKTNTKETSGQESTS